MFAFFSFLFSCFSGFFLSFLFFLVCFYFFFFFWFCFYHLSWVWLVFASFSFFLFSLSCWTACGLLDSLTMSQAWVGVLSPGCWTTREFLGPGNSNRHVFSQRYPRWHQDLALHNCLQTPVLDTSCQTTSKMGSQTYPTSDILPKVILACRHPQTPRNVALFIRGKSLSFTHQSTGTSPPTGKTTQVPGPTSSTRA